MSSLTKMQAMVMKLIKSMIISIHRQSAPIEDGLQKKMERRKTRWRVKRNKKRVRRLRLEESSMGSIQEEEVVEEEVEEFSSFVGNQRTEEVEE